MIKSSLPAPTRRPRHPTSLSLALLLAVATTLSSAIAADKAPMIRPTATPTPKPVEKAVAMPPPAEVKPAEKAPPVTKPAESRPAPPKPAEPKAPAPTVASPKAAEPTAPIKTAPEPKATETKTPETPAAFTNSLGMRFVELPKFPVLFSIWKTRVRDYQAYARDRGREPQTPDFAQSPNHPVVMVNWEDTAAFCAWLTKREHASATLPADWSYRLPTDEEWSAAVGLPPISDTISAVVQPRQFPWGKDWPPPPGAGNYHSSLRVDPYPFTSPVGAFKPNALGIYDLGGNAWEWCEDIYNNSPDQRVLRGGSWRMKTPNDLLAGTRVGNQSSIYLDTYGFRCVIQKGAATKPAAGEDPPAIKQP